MKFTLDDYCNESDNKNKKCVEQVDETISGAGFSEIWTRHRNDGQADERVQAESNFQKVQGGVTTRMLRK